MVIDNEEHRLLLLEMLNRVQFVGAARKIVAELGEAIERAEIGPVETRSNSNSFRQPSELSEKAAPCIELNGACLNQEAEQ